MAAWLGIQADAGRDTRADVPAVAAAATDTGYMNLAVGDKTGRPPGDDTAAQPAAAPSASPAAGLRESAARLLGLLDRPLTSYYLIIGCTLLLLALGLAMVLSTSSALALDHNQAPYAGFQKQLLGAVFGLGVMWLAARASPRLYRASAYPMMGLAVLGLILVLAVGHAVQGATREITVAGFALQPSEFAKLAFVLWGADLLARKEKLGQLTDWRQLLIPLMPGTAILALLVLLGNDLGTTVILLVIFLALLWVMGSPGRLFIGMLGLMAFVVVVLIIVEPYRLQRFLGFLNPGAQPLGAGMQELNGQYALGSGGPLGVGLGASRSQWGWVPESSTDFIFAILGEELGLVGTLSVIFLYTGIAYAGIRIARRMQDTFMRMAAAAVTVWIVAQALVNMGAVLGLLPITGIPLPLVSAGLSSLLVTITALGMLMCFARHEPGARQALAQAGPGVPRRILSWLGLGPRRR
ncbi:MAG TPA: putative peptidoglycan glycosyltransferase FtsW [Streptosporangiaceae bacterium]|jgi:cell division protein FtsW